MFSSCKHQSGTSYLFPYTKEKIEQLKALRKTIDEAKGEAKDSWIDLVHESSSGWEWYEKYYHTTLSDADVPATTMLPVPVYQMDSVSFCSCNTNADIANSLVLDNKNALFLVKKDSAFVVAIRSQYIGGSWFGGDDSGIFPGIAQKYYLLYSQGIPFYAFYLYSDSKSTYHVTYAFYDNGKELMEIRSDGSKVPLIQTLNAVRDSQLKFYKNRKR
jgi:hypothetical protein